MSSDRRGSVGGATVPASAAASADGAVSEGVADDPQADDPWFAPGPKKAFTPGDADAYADAAPTSPAEASSVQQNVVGLNTGEPNTGEPNTGGLKTGGLKTGEPNTGDASNADDGAGMASAATDEHAGQTEWFLRTGREGLHPDSVTPWDDVSGESPTDHPEVRVSAAGAPPWAGETTAVSATTPPPWETGPWPGAGTLRPGGSRPAGDGQAGDGQAGTPASGAAATAGLVGGSAAVRADVDGGAAVATPVRWSARTVLTAGLIPLVVPGLVLGFLSLRQAGSEAVRKASWLAIGASIAWAVIIIVIVASVSGGSPGACNGYPAAVHQAYEKALTDLHGNAPASTEASDLQTAASLANSSAAGAGQIGVRDALFTMANDLAQARADVVAGRPISASLRQHLAADGTVPSGSCAS
jgi:hypothetical protein